MASQSADPISDLFWIRANAGLEVATVLLYHLDPCEFSSELPDMDHLKGNLLEFEAALCGLNQLAGVSWDSMAGYYGVSRQSLHRRLAPIVARVLEQARMYPERSAERVHERLEFLDLMTDHLRSELEGEIGRAPSALRELRRSTNWWHDLGWRDHDAVERFQERVRDDQPGSAPTTTAPN